MTTRPILTPTQVLQRLQVRLKKRVEALQRVKLAGYEFVISETEVELDYLRRAGRYLKTDVRHDAANVSSARSRLFRRSGRIINREPNQIEQVAQGS
jgi:hypothetical protein